MLGSLILAVLLALNPAILFILSESALVAVGSPALGAVLVAILYRRFELRLPTVYVVNGMSVLGVFLYGEVVFTTVFPDYIIEDLYQLRGSYYFNKPNLTSRIEGKEYAVDYLTNVDGFRIGYSQYTDKTYAVVDWLFIGDSFTQAAQVNFEDMFTSLLYRQYPDRIVANVGVSGLGLPQELALYKDLGRQLKPGVVFLQLSPFNDFVNVRETRAGFSDILANRSNFIRFLVQDLKYKNPAELPLGRWTEPFHPSADENRDYNVFYTESSDLKRADLQAFRDYLEAFHRAVAEDGAELIVLLIPTKEQISATYLEEVVDAFQIDLTKLDLDAPQRMVRQLSDSLGFRLIDLWEPFATASEFPFFDYDEHMSLAGHKILAEAVARELGLPDEGPRVLSAQYSGDRYPSPDADGNVYFQSPADGSSEIFVGDGLLGSASRLTYDDVDQSHPAPSPGGAVLAFTEGPAESGRTKIRLSDRSGRGGVLLPTEGSAFGAIPAFNPDGARIAYAHWTEGARGQLSAPRIAVSDLQGDSVAFISPIGEEAWRPVFSPDGQFLTFIMKVGAAFDLFETDLRSGKTEQLTHTPFDEWDPRYSPDGRWLVYAARADDNWDLFRISRLTGDVDRITRTRGDEWDPAYTIDGQAILYGGEYGIFRGIYLTPIP